MKYYITCVVFILCACEVLNGQGLKGTILNESNLPLENAYVLNNSTNKHAHTRVNGSFVLEDCSIRDTITISLLGYEKKMLTPRKSELSSGITIVLKSKIFVLDELVITEQINALNSISRVDLETTPVNSSQEIMRKVPGLFIGQHAGGGKAEQIFLRGFDIDHGTDITLSVDGMPINMVSHAHGQGYSDLHFIIPETIDKINFDKGPYRSDKGDFSTAGHIGFETKRRLNQSEIKLEIGDFNTVRTLGMFNMLPNSSNQNAYLAAEYIGSDGPFESSQNFNRINILGKYSTLLKGNDRLTLTLSHFDSRWDASGQIPKRAVDSGLITRFGAIDDTEGGTTSRSNFNVQYDSFISDNTQFKGNAFYSKYDFELYSNFTFFLEDPINGDQIRQREDRNIFGFNAQFNRQTTSGETDANYTLGVGLRHDINNDVELSKTLNRSEVLDFIQLGDINQTNMFAYANADFEFGKFVLNPALRLDYFKFLYNDALAEFYGTLSEAKTTLSPKLNFLYNHSTNVQLFLKTGISFHSNDVRVVVQTNGKDILPKAYGVDLGGIWKPTPKLALNTALWYLFLEQEFVYVGDAGIVEPSGKTRRYGVDFGLRYQIADWLYFDSDATYTNARSTEAPDGEDLIPLAPEFTLAGGLSFTNFKKFSGGIRYRYLGDRPANEDNSIVAEGYFVADANISYDFGNVQVGLIVENMFDIDWNETQFATESKLQTEVGSVEEIHFTPGVPFFLKANLTYTF